MATITKKIAKNGAEIWYVDGKRVSRETAQLEERNNRRAQRWLDQMAAEKIDAAIDDYAVTVDAQDVAIDAEIQNANTSAEPTDAEKFQRARKVIRRSFTDSGRQQWLALDSLSEFSRISKATAIAILKEFGLTIETFLAEQEKFINAEIARGAAKMVIEEQARHIRDKVARESKPVDDSGEVFNLLPVLDELNDTRSDIEKELDEFAAKDTDRDDRFNRGERYAEKLTAKLRKFNATVKVTYDIDEYDEDTYYLEFDGIYPTPFTLDGVESSFHALKRYIAELATPVIEIVDEELTPNMKLAAEIVNSLPGRLEWFAVGFTENGAPTIGYDVINGSMFSPMIHVTEAFTDETKSVLDYVEVERDYAETKTSKTTRYYFRKPETQGMINAKAELAETPETKESLRKKASELTDLKKRLDEEIEYVECARDNIEVAQKWMDEASAKFGGKEFYAEQAKAIDATIEILNERIAELAAQMSAVKAELKTVNKKIADFKHAA